MAGVKLQLRISAELNDRLEAFSSVMEAEGEMAPTRSTAARVLLETALGTPALDIASQEAIMLLAQVQQRLISRVIVVMQEEIRSVLEEELQSRRVVD